MNVSLLQLKGEMSSQVMLPMPAGVENIYHAEARLRERYFLLWLMMISVLKINTFTCLSENNRIFFILYFKF